MTMEQDPPPPTEWSHILTFALNGRKIEVDGNAFPRFNDLRLIDYIRDQAGLTGTKLSCGEGGCGACTVVLCHRSPFASSQIIYRSVNACLIPLAAIDGMDVLTVEGVGSTRHRLHPIQSRMVDNYSMQCGFCTPGWVMNMYELLQTSSSTGANDPLTKDTIENHFDGNLCRCTGYRPILQTMQSFSTASTAPTSLEYESYSPRSDRRFVDKDEPDFEFVEREDLECDHTDETRAMKQCTTSCDDCPHQHHLQLGEIEDLGAPYKPELDDAQVPDFIKKYTPVPLAFHATSTAILSWYRVISMDQLVAVQAKHSADKVMVVGGLTSRGVSKYFNGTAPYNHAILPTVLIDINFIPELQTIRTTDTNLSVGASVSLTVMLSTLHAIKGNPCIQALARHVSKIANHQVRNAGTWAGNLALARHFPSFPSDLATGLVGYGAALTVRQGPTLTSMSIEDFLSLPDTANPLLMSLELPLYETSSLRTFKCHKVAQRKQNSHAHVNAAMMIVLNADHVCTRARVVFHGVGKLMRCTQTENALTDRLVTDPTTLTSTMTALESDMQHLDAFKQSVVHSFWYKTMLEVAPALSSARLASGRYELPRQVSSGHQVVPTVDGGTAPVGQSIPKLSAKLLATGEAKYVGDALPLPGLLYGALVFSTKALAKVVQLNTQKALNVQGVVDVVTAADIPGANRIGDGDEPLFVPVQGNALYVGAALGLVLATSADVAQHAASLVDVEYGAIEDDPFWTNENPITTVAMAREANTFVPSTPDQANPICMPQSDDHVEDKIAKAPHQLKGSVAFGSQRHFYMEPQATTVYPDEDECYRVEASTQNPTGVQAAIARVLNRPMHAVEIKMKRAGGGFGGKLTRCNVNATAAAIAAHKHGVAVQVINDRNTDFRNVAGRNAMVGEYHVGFDNDGHLLALDLTFHFAMGAFAGGDNCGECFMAILWSDGAYHVPSFRARGYMYLSNTPTCTSVRAPGVPNSVMLLEMVIEHVAQTLQLPVEWVQKRNFVKDNDRTPYGQMLKNVTLGRIWTKLHESANVARRREAHLYFNSQNKWKKKGLAVTPVKYGIGTSGLKYGATVSIFHGDGSVVVSHGGCEIGQGIDTKAAQMAAYMLKIPLTKIRLQPTSTGLIPNSDATGGSSTSESIARSVQAACATLMTRLEPVRAKLPQDASWEVLIQRAHDEGVQLFAGEQPNVVAPPGQQFDYFVYAAACSEVEVDILTGELNVLRTDVMYDCGKSFNPLIDIGQIEGAFVMALGLFFQESVEYDAHGQLVTSGTWEYKIPSHKDIPEILNVTLLDKAENPQGVMSSKAVGEPPFQLVNSVYFALKHALYHSRLERNVLGFFQLDMPATVDRRLLAASVKPTDFQL
ncbi:hypothetical protein H310_08056 [Aphanomyces invadans]|uniref:FAD-binding PCMH-type domain-containing protein n=1 Tax=Aphanomyces invadans TaxID=157072 RepID=A0A024TZC4_9STRA|nr:hypothetical protein H310_08056 [Aphanomyces invadans]ETV99329.1 hypothetical protein H310_08056 [Aphanomyces invadans]|eukprot:XP_008871885.1 hypothetical protein H310_08056 [Aphanomyces invadans]